MYHLRLRLVLLGAYWICTNCRTLSNADSNQRTQTKPSTKMISNHDRTGRYRVCITWVPLKYASTWINLREVVFLVSCFLWTLPSCLLRKFRIPCVKGFIQRKLSLKSMGHEHLMPSNVMSQKKETLALNFGWKTASKCSFCHQWPRQMGYLSRQGFLALNPLARECGIIRVKPACWSVWRYKLPREFW